MNLPNQRNQRLKIIFAVLIGITIPCYFLGYTFVTVNRRNQPTPTPRVPYTATFTEVSIITDTPGPIIPTRYPTFTPSLTPTSTPSRTASQTPSKTPSPSWTPQPTNTFTPSASSTETDLPPATTEPPPPTASEE
ncbi:MAG: hypothetical protein HQ574_02855 [Chloroflexi bacterium]|nr:hypothetical protein [Chloroflexota bacterium]